MANVQATQVPKTDPGTSRVVSRKVRGRAASDGAGVKLMRVIGGPDLPDLDPFLLLDEFRSDDPGDYLAGFPDHPHRGFETVTYMLAGRMRHGDNKGNTGLLRAGSVQWMTAGRGIVHSEMPEQEDGLIWGFQLWVNLPGEHKMAPPRYQDIAPEQIPEVDLGGGVRARVIAGRLRDAEGPVRGIATEPQYLDVALAVGATTELSLPPAHHAFAYVFDGEVGVGPVAAETRLARGELGVLGPGERLRLAAGEGGGRLIIVAGRPLDEPIVRYGPFVMNTRDQIREAIDDYSQGRF
ncbi:MAG TPA: pirin family protein [Casimicrobiaceae bacterium]|nr:pirin family protein [Casimicrobiaceae bacterium]